MSRVIDALTWSGAAPEICVFLAVPDGTIPSPRFELPDDLVAEVRSYHLEDDRNLLAGVGVYEYDVVLTEVPADLESALESLLRQTQTADCRVAWLAFEGSFDFAHVLTEHVAELVFGVCDAAGRIAIAVGDAQLSTPEWRASVERTRRDLEACGRQRRE